MTSRITLLCVPASRALRAGHFPADDPLEPEALERAAGLADSLGLADLVLRSPERCARQTADALGRAAEAETALREAEYGRWRGRSLKAVAAAEPEALNAWLSDLECPAPEGESLLAMIEHVGHWFEHFGWPAGHALVIAHGSVIKAILLRALNLPSQAYRQIDVAPLARIELSRHQDLWRLRLGSDDSA
ncbi:histidine phosphatase family protein [Chromobacterium vaccinii]|uniref:Histidine phosphatase family protein n=1 Tax=Chromobacterium vaccinii TaxID=1108595 RepID=A0ABV0FCP8_9NEIS